MVGIATFTMLVSSTDMNIPMTTTVSGRPHPVDRGAAGVGADRVAGPAGGVLRGVPPLRAVPCPAPLTSTRAPAPAVVPGLEPVSVCGLVSVRVPLPAVAGAVLVPERDIEKTLALCQTN